MYCPKCKQSFEEGSRRFCPTDGSRLVSDAPFSAGRRSGGVFANIVAKNESMSEAFADVPQFEVTEVSPIETLAEDSGADFFEFENVEPDPIIDLAPAKEPAQPPKQKPEQPIGPKPKQDKPPVRKIKPFEIPAGHVEVGEGKQRLSSHDFPADDPESFVGRTVKGRYQVTEFLGGEEGSFAFLADDKLADDRLVLVRILEAEQRDQMSGNILDDEIVALSHISHPNIARLIDSGKFNDGTRFLITEYVDALSVNDILSIHGKLDGARTARIIRQVANALTEVHQEGVIHRDLRPENIIVIQGDDEKEQAILVNFGASDGEPNEHNIGYKAPEVFDGRGSSISSDVFSLAVVAYEMLTGTMPFQGETAREVVRAQYSGLERLPSKFDTQLPAAVDYVLDRALDLAERYVNARDFGEAFYAAFAEAPKAANLAGKAADLTDRTVPAIISETGSPSDEPAWKNRSPEPPRVDVNPSTVIAAGIFAVIVVLALGWYFTSRTASDQTASGNTQPPFSAIGSNTEMPPQPRQIAQPPNTIFYQNTRQNLKGDLIRNFVGFTLYYPKDWKVNGPQESAQANARGKFLDISRLTPDGRLKEQMLVSYYASKGTFKEDADKFPQLAKETNDTLKKILPDYKVVSTGETNINGVWRAYEVKFEGGGTAENGEKLVVWGRRLFIPASRPGVRDGFEITMLATSLADDVHGVDDVGVRGELAPILYSFEPSQNF
jgi:serine/threonine-protein kinase